MFCFSTYRKPALLNLKNVLINPSVKRYIFNSSWMLAEQCLRIIAGVFVGIYIARYLGPEKYGVLSYSLAISAFALAISKLGMDAVLVRELSVKHAKTDLLIGTSFWLMLMAAIVCYLIMLVGVWLLNESSDIKLYILLMSSSVFFSVFLVGDYYFQANVEAKFSAMCKVFTLLIMSIAKLVLVFLGADIFYFVLFALFDHVLLAFFLFFFICKIHGIRIFKFFNKGVAKVMLRSSLPMVLTAVASLIYMRIDQVMIRSMLGMHEVGIYSAAVRVYEAWIVFPYIVTVSLIPAIVRLKEGDKKNYHLRLEQLFKLVIWMSVAVAVIVTLLGEQVMVFAFGDSYASSGPVLSIVMWTAVLASIGSVSARFFNVERMERKIASRTILAAVMNVLLNYIMIPAYGIEGAAISTLVCMLVANYLLDWFDKDLTELLAIKHRAIFGRLCKR